MKEIIHDKYIKLIENLNLCDNNLHDSDNISPIIKA